MKIKIWGARGSIPAPLTSQSIREKIITALQGANGVDLNDPLAIRAYVDSLPPLVAGTAGGNTACVEMRTASQLFVIDAGTGIRQLGLELMSGPCGRGEGVIHLFLSHTHWDHIQGLPFFLPAFVPGNQINIYSVHSVEPVLAAQMQPATFPISLDHMRARATIRFIPLEEVQTFVIGDVAVTPKCLPHPGSSYAYRFEHQGSVAIYASDAEYKYLDDQHLQPFVRFFAGADVLIFDAQYTLRESLIKEDWGHSSALVGAEIARRAGVKRLVLFHHDPNSSDEDLRNIFAQVTAYQAANEPVPACEVTLAVEGLTIDLEPRGSFSVRRPCAHSAVLAISGDFDQRALPSVLEQVAGTFPAMQLPRLVVDLGGMPQLSIGCLRALIDLRRHWGERPMALVGVSPQVLQVIELAHCSDLFTLFPEVDLALEALAARDTLSLPGQLLKGRYRIESILGESDLGIIVRASDIRLERPVMIKVLSPALSQSITRAMLREAQPMARLQAPNIVTLYDCDEDQGLAYMVMEYVGCQTLRDLLRRDSQLPPLAIAMGLLRGLEYAHSKGVIHGNLKPENILIADEVKLTDFALGRVFGEHALAEAHRRPGIPYYLAPEQIAGTAVDARADLYALGVILYELFTGRRPFEGDEPQVLEQHLHVAPVPPRQLNPELSRSQEFMILKLLAKNPDQRYASAAQVRRVLSSLESTPAHREALASGLQSKRPRKLIGREQQLAWLLRTWQRAQRGEGQVVLITGESGVGKTSLAEELAAHAAEATVAVGHCSELEGSPPYQPFVEIARDYLLSLPQSEVLVELGDAAPLLALLVPELQVLAPRLPASVPLEPQQERQRLMHSFTQLVARATASRPWLMILDDLHWADSASLELLHYLARYLPTMPLLIVGIYRNVELERNHPLRELVRGLSRTQVYQHTVLDRLDEAGVRELVCSLLGAEAPDEWIAAIYQRTGGNPFYVEEVVRTLIDDGTIAYYDGHWSFAPIVEVKLPQSVRDIVLRRVERLTPPTQDLLRRAAVLGQQCSFADLLAVAEQAEDQLLELIDEALGSDLLRELDSGTTLAFSHPEIQQVVYEDLSALRRRSLHRRAGNALEQRHSDHLDSAAGQLAYHFLQAGDGARGFAYSLRAAQHARALHAYQVALHWFNQARELLPEGDCCAETRIELYEGLGATYYLHGRYAEATAAYTAMQQVARDAGDRAAQARVWNGLSDVHARQGDHRAALDCAQRAADLAQAVGSQRELATALYGQGRALKNLGHAEQAIALCEQVLSLSRRLAFHDMAARSQNLLGIVLHKLGRFEQAAVLYEEALAICRREGDRRWMASILNNWGEMYRLRGDYQQALPLYKEALAIADEAGIFSLQQLLMNNLAAVEVGLGEYRSAAARLREVIDATESDGWFVLSEAYRLLSEACLGLGQGEEALAAAKRALIWGRANGQQEQLGCAWRTLGSLLVQGAGQLSLEELATIGVAVPMSVPSSTQSIAARDCFAESARILAEVGVRAEQARTLASWALYELGCGDRERGESLWQEAQELLIGLGMQAEVQRIAARRPHVQPGFSD